MSSNDRNRPPQAGLAAGLPLLWEVVALVLITALGAFLRLYRIAEIPPGLHFDEAFQGVMARGLLAGDSLPLFFPANQGEEPLAIYLVAAGLRLLGEEPWVIRLCSAIEGALTVPLAWWLGRGVYRLARSLAAGPGTGPDRSTRLGEQVVGLSTALVLAILYWHLNFSRLGMEPILVPLFATLAFAALVHALNSASRPRSARWAFVLAGIGLGGGLYTYKAGYLVPVVAALFAGYAALVERGFLRRHWRGLLLVVVVAAIVATPLTIYFVTHPEDFLHRPTDVSLVGTGRSGEPLQAVADNVLPVLGMFFVEGDANPRSNLPGRPALDPVLALLFLVGLGRALFSWRRPAWMLPVLWVGVMILPTLVTEYAPHFARALGATPAIALLCALGIWTLWQGASAIGRRWVLVASGGLLALGLAFSGVSAASAYFQTWAQSPDLFYAYDVGLREVAGFMRQLPADMEVYLTPTRPDHYTVHFVAGRPFATFDGRDGLVLPPADRPAVVIVVVQEDGESVPALKRFRPDASLVRTWDDGYGRTYAEAYALQPVETQAPQPDQPGGAVLGDAVELLGYSVDRGTVRAGERINLTLYWRALADMDRDYTVFTHLLGPHNPATNGPLWAGHDGQPDGGHYPTKAWKPGEIVLDVHPLTLAVDAPPGPYQLEAGLYLLETMARLPAREASGAALANDAIVLGVIEVVE
jgi:4-amino-4-deoxy-L-arabinose transferase-like glycosyltransferase